MPSFAFYIVSNSNPCETRTMLVGLALAVLIHKHSQEAPESDSTPSGYLANHKWNASSKGPLLYLPNRRLQTDDVPQLERGFRAYNCGSIHVIAPCQMTIIDPDYRQEPNIYEGLPRDLKVLYLASTFNKSQMEMASTTGIGMSSLNKDQQAVYRSILPSVFKYQTSTVVNPFDRNGPRNPSTETTLTPDQESQVLLKFYKELTLGVRLGNDGGFSAISGQQWDRHKVGTKISSRIDIATEDKNSAFGIEIRKSLPNESKPSDLDYKSSKFDPAITLASALSIKDLCKEISDRTHQTVLADARFQNEEVGTIGATARCGDVLKGLALSLTGTYRRVGNTYVLTSDLEGIGTKMTKLAFWHWNLKQRSGAESEKWKNQIATNPGIRAISYAPDDPLTPNAAMQKFMSTDFDQGDKTMPATLLSPEWSKLLNSKDNHFGETLRTDVAEPWDSVFWCFVVPGPEVLTWESQLADMNEFTRYSERHPVRPQRKDPKRADLSSSSVSALVYQSENLDDSSKLPEIAHKQGFGELWLQTTNKAALNAAINTGKTIGMKVKLVVEPFTALAPAGKDQIDRNILGSGYVDARTMIDQSEWVQTSNKSFSSNARLVSFLDETHPKLQAYWSRLSELAKVAGPNGTVVLSGTPVGYEKQSDWPEYTPPQLIAPLSLGYTTTLREEFIRSNSVDPVDLLEVRDEVQLQPIEQSISSFGNLNNYLFGKVSETPPSFRDKWDRFRSLINEQQVEKFLSNFTGPILLEWRRKLHDTSLYWSSLVSTHTDGLPLNSFSEDPFYKPIPDDGYLLQPVGFPLSDGTINYLRSHIAESFKKKPISIALDFRAVPANRLIDTLNTLLVPKVK